MVGGKNTVCTTNMVLSEDSSVQVNDLAPVLSDDNSGLHWAQEVQSIVKGKMEPTQPLPRRQESISEHTFSIAHFRRMQKESSSRICQLCLSAGLCGGSRNAPSSTNPGTFWSSWSFGHSMATGSRKALPYCTHIPCARRVLHLGLHEEFPQSLTEWPL